MKYCVSKAVIFFKVFTRPYPPATAGTPVRLQYDVNTRIAYYEFIPGMCCTESGSYEKFKLKLKLKLKLNKFWVFKSN